MSRLAGSLVASGITKSYGSVVVLAGVDLVVPPHARIGLVGPNGVGKSTLLRLLAGLEEPDAGSIRVSPPELTVGYLPQEPELREGETLADYLARRTGVAAAESALDSLTERPERDPSAIEPHARALERFLALGGGDLRSRAAATCAQLGLDVPLDADMTGLSGGEAARAQLAAILLARFDVFLLDEPTNDLDFDGLGRLERFVAEAAASIVVVSHDRRFLDRTVDRVVELDEWTHGAREYTGGWSEYERRREVVRRQHYVAYEEFVTERERLRQQLRRMQEWERRGYGQGRKKKKTKDVKSAIGGRVARLQAVDKPY